jgi:RNA 3'-terminal phosphate cyclase (ATP)
MNRSLIDIDGSQGEGGGQVLRTSLALSLITGKPFRLRNIRARRSKPGLQAAARIGSAKLRGAALGSVDLTFEPGPVKPGDYHFKIGTAGATSLVLHTIYLPLVLAGGESTVTIEGGTHVKASPCFHFLERSWASYLKALGITVEVRLDRVGFYPRGGGMIHARILGGSRPAAIRAMTTKSVESLTVTTLTAGLPMHVADRMEQTATARLREWDWPIALRHENWPGGPGCLIGIEVPTEPAPTFLFALGEKGKPAEAVAHEAVDQVECFLRVEPLGVDEHSADQLLLPLATADGASEFRVAAISSHLLTNADVIEHFLDRQITCDGDQGEPGVVTVG